MAAKTWGGTKRFLIRRLASTPSKAPGRYKSMTTTSGPVSRITLQRVNAVGCGCDNGQIVSCVDDRLEIAQRHRFVVDDDYVNCHTESLAPRDMSG